MGNLDDSRIAIDNIDRQLIAALAERMRLVSSIAAIKNENSDVPLRNEVREREVLERWSQEGAQYGLSPYFLGRILREVLNYSRRDQESVIGGEAPPQDTRSVRVAFQGAPSSYSDLAIEKLFISRPTPVRERIGLHSFSAALDALEAGDADYALLPIENTIAGSINGVYRLLGERTVHVVDEEYWLVEHVLAGLPGTTVEDLEVIRSHPVALQQCETFLEQLVGCRAESYYDTAASARSVVESGDRAQGSICSEQAALRAGLSILQRGIADRAHNTTRFLLLGMEPETVDSRIRAKTSLVFTANHRRGALAACLQRFAEEGINLCKLESRPQSDSPWEYLFYLDVEGNVEDAHLQGALKQLEDETNHLRVMGCYPDRRPEND
ncbi:MAG: chorismate mutase/prephenate dehydratase [Candidatus Paceibacteria bacterium]|jgi:chorismate mutase/prephenate dehydratase